MKVRTRIETSKGKFEEQEGEGPTLEEAIGIAVWRTLYRNCLRTLKPTPGLPQVDLRFYTFHVKGRDFQAVVKILEE
jgi:hypothetical protein